MLIENSIQPNINVITVRKRGIKQTNRNTIKSNIVSSKCANIERMSQENLRNRAHPSQEVSNVNIISLRIWGNEQNNRYTRNVKLAGTILKISHECFQKL